MLKSRFSKFVCILSLALIAIPSFTYAAGNGKDKNGNLSAVKSTIKLNSHEQKQASRLAKLTNLSRDKVAELMDNGYTEDEIKTVCVVKFFTKDSIDKIFSAFDKVDMDQEKLLEKYEISQEDYQKQYQKLFKSDEDGNKTMRDNVPWRKAPFQ